MMLTEFEMKVGEWSEKILSVHEKTAEEWYGMTVHEAEFEMKPGVCLGKTVLASEMKQGDLSEMTIGRCENRADD